MKIMEDWNNNIDDNNECFEEALEALKKAKTKVTGRKRQKFENLAKFTKDVINYFQDDLLPKLTIKSGGTNVILKKVYQE